MSECGNVEEVKKINNGAFVFSTRELQSLGVVETEVKVYFDTSFVSELVEKSRGYAKVTRDYFNNYDIEGELATFVRNIIRSAAIEKIKKTFAAAKREYEIVLTANDVDFTELEEKAEYLEKRDRLKEEVRNEINRLKDIVKAVEYWYTVYLVDGTEIKIYDNVSTLEKALAELRNVDVNKVLRNAIEMHKKKIEELERENEKLRREKRELLEKLKELEKEEEDV